MREGIQPERLATNPEELQDRGRREDRVEGMASVDGGNFVENILQRSVYVDLAPAVPGLESPLQAVDFELPSPNVLPEDASGLRESQP